jgi:hypothetical protein
VKPVALLVLAPLLLTACGSGDKAQFIPPGSWAGSTAGDRPFTLDISDKPTVNKRKARFVEHGVLEVKDHGVTTTIRCTVVGKKAEELRCDVRTAPPGGAPPTTEVIDLMLL